MHAIQHPPEALRQRAEYYDRIGRQHMTPLWEVLGALVPPQPRPQAASHLWRYGDLRDQVMEAGRLVGYLALRDLARREDDREIDDEA